MSLEASNMSRVDDGLRSRDDGAKYRQIMDGARSVFLKDGFDAASMNEIARVAGVSKGTLYVYFDSKEALFETLIREEKREQAEQTCRFDHSNHDVETTLREFGERLLDRMFRPASIAHLRIVASVAARFPSIGRAFYEAGPKIGYERMADYFKAQVEAGVMSVDNPLQAARFFCDICKSTYLPVLLCVEEPPSAKAIAAHVEAAVRVFLRAYPMKNARER